MWQQSFNAHSKLNSKFIFLQRFLATVCCLLLAINLVSSQQEISITELLEEAKIDTNKDNLLKEAGTPEVKKDSAAPPKKETGLKKESEPAEESEASSQRPRLFRPKGNRPSFKNILQAKIQDQQRSESQLVSNNNNDAAAEQPQQPPSPPRQRFRPTSTPASTSPAALASGETESPNSEVKPAPSRSTAQRSFASRYLKLHLICFSIFEIGCLSKI